MCLLSFCFACAAAWCFYSFVRAHWKQVTANQFPLLIMFCVCVALSIAFAILHSETFTKAVDKVARSVVEIELGPTKVHMDSTIAEANEAIQHLKEISIINARNNYTSLGYVLMGQQQQAKDLGVTLLPPEFDEQLAGLGVDETQRNEIARPYTQAIGLTIFQGYRVVLSVYNQWVVQSLSADKSEAGQKKLEAHNKAYDETHNPILDGLKTVDDVDWDEALKYEMPAPGIFDDKAFAIMKAFQEHTRKVYADVKAKRAVTPEALEYNRIWHDGDFARDYTAQKFGSELRPKQ